MSPEISQTRYVILGSAIILFVFIAGCYVAPSGAPQTPAETMATTPVPTSPAPMTPLLTTTPLPTTLAPTSHATVPQTTQTTIPVPAVNQTPTPPPVMEIAIQNNGFNPKTVKITAGTTVIWTNSDTVHHQISNSGIGATLGPGKIFASEALGKGDTYSFTFATAGIYPYFDVMHPSMLGTITVT